MIKCVAIDDEPIALNIISEHCRRYGGLELESFSSPAAGLKYLEENSPDVLFLDIEMPRHNGMEIARLLPPGICVIFTSAYAQYALDGFNVNAVDFLHKPIFYPRFQQAMDKALKWFDLNARHLPEVGALTLRSEHRDVFVPYSEQVAVLLCLGNTYPLEVGREERLCLLWQCRCVYTLAGPCGNPRKENNTK